MKIRTATHYENAHTFTDPLPEQSAFVQLEELFTARRREIVLAKKYRFQLQVIDAKWPEAEAQASDTRSRIVDQLAEAKMRLAATENEIDDLILETAEAIRVERAEMETQ